MRRRTIRNHVLSVQIDANCWLILESMGCHVWNLRVVGPEPLERELLDLTVREAAAPAVVLSSDHFKDFNPCVIVPASPQWRHALLMDEVDSARRRHAQCGDIDSSRCAGISEDLPIASIKDRTFSSRTYLPR